MFAINILLIILFPFSKNFYMLRYGHLLMNYYENMPCIGNFKQINYSVPDNEELKILNANGTKDFGYSFNYFASQIYYNNEDEEEDEEEESQDGGAFVCNGACYKRAPNSDILVKPDSNYDEKDYESLSDNYKAYSCIYNNIIKSATIDIMRYSDKKCKSQLNDEYHFTGKDFCWTINEGSFRPLYYEDDEDKIYYHSYKSTDCKSEYFDYFVLNENYLICNSKCQKERTDSEKSYRCTFKSNNTQYLNQNNILFLLLIISIFNIL